MQYQAVTKGRSYKTTGDYLYEGRNLSRAIAEACRYAGLGKVQVLRLTDAGQFEVVAEYRKGKLLKKWR